MKLAGPGSAVDSGEKSDCSIARLLVRRSDVLFDHRRGRIWSSDMRARPSDLADWMSEAKQVEVFTLPLDAARCKAREIIDQSPHTGFTTVVQNWRQLPDGRIEFAIRHFPAADSDDEPGRAAHSKETSAVRPA
jgi:hypothetical protein